MISLFYVFIWWDMVPASQWGKLHPVPAATLIVTMISIKTHKKPKQKIEKNLNPNPSPNFVNMADGGCKWELIKIVMDLLFYLLNACK